jgi:predicted membrane-bound mannosyltransferase
MTTPTITQRQDSSLTRDAFHAARYYLWRPRVLLTLAAIAIVAGLALNWSWLVAAGLAPILISTLPCLVMCAFGVCMMCRSGEKGSAPVRDAAEAASPPTTLAVSATDKPSTGANSSTSAPRSIETAAPPQSLESNPPVAVADCCQGTMNETRPEQAIDLQPERERRDPHA